MASTAEFIAAISPAIVDDGVPSVAIIAAKALVSSASCMTAEAPSAIATPLEVHEKEK
jgi:hypothetical protein